MLPSDDQNLLNRLTYNPGVFYFLKVPKYVSVLLLLLKDLQTFSQCLSFDKAMSPAQAVLDSTQGKDRLENLRSSFCT